MYPPDGSTPLVRRLFLGEWLGQGRCTSQLVLGQDTTEVMLHLASNLTYSITLDRDTATSFLHLLCSTESGTIRVRHHETGNRLSLRIGRQATPERTVLSLTPPGATAVHLAFTPRQLSELITGLEQAITLLSHTRGGTHRRVKRSQ